MTNTMGFTIFKNNEVNNNFSNVIFCQNGICSCKNIIYQTCRDTWFLTSPKHTIVRVNSLSTTLQAVASNINNYLSEESLKRGLTTPEVFQHNILNDCLIVNPWNYNSKQLPRYEDEVIVDAACGAAVLRGANVFAPGIMGVMPRTKEEDLVSVYSDSSGLCCRGLSVPFLGAGKLFVGNGVLKMSRKQLFTKDTNPKGVAVEITQPASGVTNVPILQHLGILQNLPSIVCGHVLAPQPGDKVLDLCAAPGHKTTHLAALMDNKGILVALDKIPRKVEEMKALCQMMKADCVRCFLYDSTKVVSSTRGPQDWTPPFAPNTFDHVLLDAPCSALGQRPLIGYKASNKEIKSIPKLQKKLFTAAVEVLRPGGSLVYSTCSLTTHENEDIVSWALDKFPQIELVPAEPFLGRPGYLHSSLQESDCQKVQRFGPPLGDQPDQDTIGFFISKFIKLC